MCFKRVCRDCGKLYPRGSKYSKKCPKCAKKNMIEGRKKIKYG